MKQQGKNPRPQQANSGGGKTPQPQSMANSRISNAQPSSSVEAKPTLDDIRRRAYEIYLDRQHTGQSGTPTTDWEQAERELRARASAR